MAFEGKKSPDTLSGVGESARVTTSVPESAEQSTNFDEPSRVKHTAGLSDVKQDADDRLRESVAERERRQRLSTVPPPSRRTHSNTASFPGRAERRVFDGEKNSQPPPYARRLSSRPTVPPRESAGYYSLRDEQLEEVKIPKAPRVPLDFEEISPDLIPPVFVPKVSGSQHAPTSRESSCPESMDTDAFATIPTPPPSRRERASSFETKCEELERGASMEGQVARERRGRRNSRDTMRSTSPPPSHSQVTTRSPERGPASLRSPVSQRDVRGGRPGSLADFDPPSFAEVARPSDAPPRIYFSPHVRRQANDWAETGSLSIPGCSSPRHARALQRALLLALLTEPGWDSLPQGLRQRAGWLFNEGWESNSSEGRAFREIDDLATMLSLDASPQSRATLSRAVLAVIPQGQRSRRTSDLPPSSRRR